MGSHDLIMARNDLAEVFGSDTAMDSATIRQRYLDQPLPVHLHFTEQDIDPFPWRHRTDYTDLSVDLWNSCAAAGAAKHDVARFPFHFSIAL
jgi:hypothetical protein